MIPIGTMTSIEAVLRAAPITRPADRRQLAELFHRVIGVDPSAPATPSTDTVLSIKEAARILGRTPRTIRQYAATGAIRALRTGRSRKLTGIPASELDAFIAKNTMEGRPCEL